MAEYLVSVNDCVDFLNEMLDLDRGAIDHLISQRVACNRDMANHKTVQVVEVIEDEMYMVGFLGLLNGLFGANDRNIGYICAVFDQDKKLQRFVVAGK